MSPESWSHEPIEEVIKRAIENAIPHAQAQVTRQGNHFSLIVTSEAFAGKSLLEKQRLVYSAITPWMTGAEAPIHAVDSLKTLLPGR